MAAYLGHTKAPQVILDCQRSSFLQGVERHTVILAKFLAELHHKRGLAITTVAPHEPAAPDFRSVEGILPFPFKREYVILLVQDVPDIQARLMPAFLLSFFSSSIVRTVLVVGYCQFGQVRPAVWHPAVSRGKASCRVPTEGHSHGWQTAPIYVPG